VLYLHSLEYRIVATLKWLECVGYNMSSECSTCGNEYCNADEFSDEFGQDMCWFWHETHLVERGRLPRNIDSYNPAYVGIVIASWLEAEGDDYDGFPTKDGLSDEQIEAMLQDSPQVLRHIE